MTDYEHTTTIQANYTSEYIFKVPNGVKLMSSKDRNDDNNRCTPGYWWIKWNILYYVGEDGNIHTVEASDESIEHDKKRPDSVRILEEDNKDQEYNW
jgi:hypothetical protein